MDLVDRQEGELRRHPLEQHPLGRADQHVLEHDVVGQHDLRRVRQHGVAPVAIAAALPGVQVEGQQAVGPVPGLELLERLKLRVDQGVHRVDDQGPDLRPLAPFAEYLVDDRQKVGEALAGAGARRDHVGPAGRRYPKRAQLVVVQAQVPTEKPRRLGGDVARVGEFAEGGAERVGGVELEHGLRPQAALRELLAHEGVEPCIKDVDEALGVGPVLPDHAVTKLKDVQSYGSRLRPWIQRRPACRTSAAIPSTTGRKAANSSGARRSGEVIQVAKVSLRSPRGARTYQ